MRVQRTRSSASPPHSPLTRYPLGRSWIVVLPAAFLSIASSACVTRHGRGYWAWNYPGYWSGSSCSAIPVEGTARLRVRVADIMGAGLPGAKVRASQTAAVASDQFETDERGEVQIPVVPGHWRVTAELLGFETARYELDILPRSQCSVCFELDLASSSVPTVT
jgi:hypothetical protein